MSKNIFVNLPVKDLKVSMDFYQKLGFEFNMDFTDDKATCMVIHSNIYVMLLTEDFFKEFSNREIPDMDKTREVIVAISVESREEVDKIANNALAAGAGKANSSLEQGGMYTRSFVDLDGHMWEVMYMEEVKDKG